MHSYSTNVDYFLLTNLKKSSNSLHLYFEYLSSYIYSFTADKAKCALFFSSFL